jgi:hypothetical protein
MDMDMQHGHGYAALTWICSIGMHAYTALTWICSIDMGMQHGYKHAA